MDNQQQNVMDDQARPNQPLVVKPPDPQAGPSTSPQPSAQPVNPVSITGGSKEFAPQHIGSTTEVAPIVEIETEPQAISPEVQEYVQKVSENVAHPEPVIHEGQVYAQPVEPNKLPDIVLPLTQQSIEYGMKQKVSSSMRWLAVWCLRIVKKFKGRVVYSPTTNQQAE